MYMCSHVCICVHMYVYVFICMHICSYVCIQQATRTIARIFRGGWSMWSYYDTMYDIYCYI